MDGFGSRTIGFNGTSGFCIRCGKDFGYNAIHPQSMCHNCKSLPEGQEQLIEKKCYCHYCGKVREKHFEDTKSGDVKRLLLSFTCEHCGRGL